MDSVELMAESVWLWDDVQQVQLIDRPDEIVWRWTANGCYSSKSAYQAQLKGTYCSFVFALGIGYRVIRSEELV
jgi:hypothetical protein